MSVNNAINTASLTAGYLYAPGSAAQLITTGATKVTRYTGSTTWTKDPKTTSVSVITWNGGGGGGSGRRGSSTASSGGGGGAQGGIAQHMVIGSFLGSSETVTVGAGGNGATAQTVDSTNGNSGSLGGISYFGNISFGGAVTAASGGSTTVVNGGVAANGSSGTGFTVSIPNQAGNGGSGQVTAGSAISTTATGTPFISVLFGSSGGGGAGADSVTERAGGNGGAVYGTFASGTVPPITLVALGAGGTESGTIGGGNGNVGLFNTGGYICGGSGAGGGGGQHTGGSAGTGGIGGVPGGGGGGGGGSLNGTNSGAGGAGGAGAVYVIEYF